tara:strand:- start:2157 stop:4478 length:2322 start_codon:yes stop_codon:yes gene_type:complete
MSLGKKLFIGRDAACTTDTADVFGDSSGLALYSLDYDASDASGNYNGSANSNVTFGVEGRINTAADFTGGGVVTIPNNVIYGNNHSVSVWFKLDNTSGYQGIFDFDYNNRIMFRVASSDANEALVGTSGWFAHNINFSANQWYHLVITFSNGNPFKIYVDGSLAYTGGNSSLNAQLGDNNFGAGNAAGVHSVNGNIDQLRIFSKELSAAEVSTLYGETACVYTSTTDNNDYPVTNAAYYKLDNNAEDAKGNYDGTATNVNYEFGRFGQAAVFNGSSSRIQISSTATAPINFSSGNFSISMWVNPSNLTNNNKLIYKWGTSASLRNWIATITTSGVLYVVEGTTAGDTLMLGTTTIPTNTWTHIAITRTQGGNLVQYINGVATNTFSTQNRSLKTSTEPLYIGYQVGQTTNFTGKIDQLRIYNSALDATAVANLYNEKPEAEPNFNAVTYTGTGNTQYISNVGIDLKTHGGLIWFKERNGGNQHQLYDNIRGYDNAIYSNATTAEYNYSTHPNGDLAPASVEANGFFTPTVANNGINRNGGTYVAWVWKGGGDAVSNTDGNITSQVSANQGAGFSIVKWTSTGSNTSTKTVGHGLSSTPEMIILKNVSSSTASWRVYHNNIPSPNNSLALNSDEIAFSFWPSVSSTNFGLAASVTTGESSGGSGQSIIAYCFHSVAGYQKVGSYSMTSNVNVTVDVGFAPRFVLLKEATRAAGWIMVDNQRNLSGNYKARLYAHSSNIESSGQQIQFIGNTFKINWGSTGNNDNGGTGIYLAIA